MATPYLKGAFITPAERIKYLLQVQPELIRAGRLSIPYGDASDCFTRVVDQEGKLSFWRCAIFKQPFLPYTRCNPYFRWIIRRMAYSYKEDFGVIMRWLLLSNKVVTVLTGDALVALVLSPLDVIRTRLACDIIDYSSSSSSSSGPGPSQLQQQQRQFTGAWDVVRQIRQVDGISGLYCGYAASASRSDLTRSLVFFGAAMFAGWVTYPFDTLRKRMIVAAGSTTNNKKTSSSPLRYKSSFHAFVQIVQTEGLRALFNGAGVDMASFSIWYIGATVFGMIAKAFGQDLT
ncbi:hypothetical protein BGZ65_010059 [Modicella reniformis]|uniref:ADP/ATP translocase n=1 Tax=Modicella reniformis TaxID=1440133 RepID=A0A9P6LTZ4_9FUNG|nr:hypothetical protein BGZ65_010059 [Modicella reniformis]